MNFKHISTSYFVCVARRIPVNRLRAFVLSMSNCYIFLSNKVTQSSSSFRFFHWNISLNVFRLQDSSECLRFEWLLNEAIVTLIDKPLKRETNNNNTLGLHRLQNVVHNLHHVQTDWTLLSSFM